MRSSQVNIGDSILASQYNNLRKDAYGGSMLLAHEQATPNLTLYVESGVCYVGNTRVVFNGGNSPSFTAPTTNPRIDLLVIDSAGTLSIIQGTPAASPVPPAYPNDKTVICEVYNRVGETSIKDADDGVNGYIYRDVRPIIDRTYISSTNQIAAGALTGDKFANLGSIPSGAGVIPSANLPTNLGATKIDVIAGENITAGDSCIIINDLEQKVMDGIISDSNKEFGNTTIQKRAIRIIPQTTITSSQITSYIARIGSPTDNIYITIQTDSGGLPSGTVITNGTSNNILGSGLSTAYTKQTFNFASAFTLNAGTAYWIVFQRSGALDNVNRYSIDCMSGSEGGSAGNNYGPFLGRYYNGTSWNNNNNRTGNFVVVIASGSPSFSAWKTNSNYEGLGRFDGFATTTVSAGQTASLLISGIFNGLSGLVAGKQYYTKHISGAITTTPTGYMSVPVGRAISSTELLIESQPRVSIRKRFSIDPATYPSSGGNLIIFHGLGRIPRAIKFTYSAISTSSNIGTTFGTGFYFNNDQTGGYYFVGNIGIVEKSSMQADITTGTNVIDTRGSDGSSKWSGSVAELTEYFVALNLTYGSTPGYLNIILEAYY
jgi:hypothetical protein